MTAPQPAPRSPAAIPAGLRRVRTPDVVAAEFRQARNDRERRELCLELVAATAVNLAGALWEEHEARAPAARAQRDRAAAVKAAGRGAPIATAWDRQAIADHAEAEARVSRILASYPDRGATRLDGALDVFDPRPAALPGRKFPQ